MRKLAWFAGGFGAACLLLCYRAPRWLFAAFTGLFLLSLLVWLALRPRRSEHTDLSLFPRRRRISFHIFRRAAALFLGTLLASAWFSAYSALFYLPAAELSGTERTVSATVTTWPEETSIGGYSLSLRLDGDFRSPDVLLYGSAAWGGVRPGDRVTCELRLEDSVFAFGKETTYYTARGLFLLGYCDEAPVLSRPDRVPLRHWPVLCAHALKEGIHAAFDSAAAPLAAAVTLGDKTGLSRQLHSALNRSGIMHTAVVSGMHISFLVAVLLFLCRGRRRVALCLVPVLIFYAFMAGGTPSAFRAVIMQTALLAGPVLNRENDPPSSLGFALLILLLQNPFAAASVSLQLSFASVAGILLVSGRLSAALLRPVLRRLPEARGLSRLLRWLCRFLATSFSVSLGAMLFTVPLIALYFGQIVVIAPLTNLLTLWAVTALMICALVIGSLAVFLPGVMALPGMAAGLLAHYVAGVSSLLGRFPLACLDADNLYFRIWLLSAYLFLLTVVLARRRLRQCVCSALCLAALLLCCVGANRWTAARSDLTLSALDVGQGACTLILSDGHSALVDCGGNSASDPGDLAADKLASIGTTRLDTLILTHLDADHFNGVPQLFWRLEIGQVFLPESATDPEPLAQLLHLAAAEGAEVHFVTEVCSLDPGITLYPPLSGGTSNEEGLFVLCSYGSFDALITGDADAFVERMLLKYYPIPDLELLLAGHHGAAGSTCGELLDALRPELAVISVGRNAYGHPADETLARLARAGTAVYRTDLSGTVTVSLRDALVSVS